MKRDTENTAMVDWDEWASSDKTEMVNESGLLTCLKFLSGGSRDDGRRTVLWARHAMYILRTKHGIETGELYDRNLISVKLRL